MPSGWADAARTAARCPCSCRGGVRPAPFLVPFVCVLESKCTNVRRALCISVARLRSPSDEARGQRKLGRRPPLARRHHPPTPATLLPGWPSHNERCRG
eukprot:scaffold18608_cov97-Isochrysis_galbana.AAC.3